MHQSPQSFTAVTMVAISCTAFLNGELFGRRMLDERTVLAVLSVLLGILPFTRRSEASEICLEASATVGAPMGAPARATVDAPVDAPVGAPVGAPADAPEAPEACPLPPANPAPNGEITSPKPVLGATAALHEELRLKAERKRFELRGKVEEIRQHIAPLTVTELWAARFLSSRRGDCKKAAQQLKHVWAFRERERAAASLDPDEGPQAPEVEAALAAYDLCTLEGLDGQGRPVFYACPGKVEMATMSKQGVTLAMVVRRHFRAMERLVQRIDAAPCPYDGHSVVLDMHACFIFRKNNFLIIFCSII